MKLPKCLLVILFLGEGAFAITFQGTVVDVPRGDRIIVEVKNRKRQEVRLLSLEAPPAGSLLSDRARNTLGQLTLQKDVIVQWTHFIPTCSKHKRRRSDCPRLGKVMVKGKDIGLEMLYLGLVRYHAEKKTDLDAEERDRYAFAEKDARGNKIGLWEEKSIQQLQKEAKPKAKTKPQGKI